MLYYRKDLKLYVDHKSVFHVFGTTIDYVSDEISSKFVFKNPNAKQSCGCGESFLT